MIAISIEKLSQRIVQKVFKGQNLSEIELAKIEYGLSLVLGILIEFILIFFVGFLLGVGYYVAVIMISSLFLRIGTGGAHCSTYRRCVTFTGIYFLPFSFVAKFVDAHNLPLLKLVIGIALIFVVLGIMLLMKKIKFFMGILVLETIVFVLFSERAFFASSIGLFLQSVMTTAFGERLVNLADNLMAKIGI
ncbi:Accessory gene regulator B [Caldanaerobacter subterraneus subsp. yonseiensis KB-1]|uniref:Accessory gene regulator B n=1 Tax=Caldanaerobacter subterraneus subsp. yonseiensis KB-1 TaxID=1388761 RepID=U5CRY3_CALSX|nr:accessory gene regulator AgrB [Caldanaerobacter subterraneus]ERM91716.1 Accessory gene regulator B [Caldanaerobacter subterraneus subsp. yonseiensis KB-1]